jgi:hypothetical protein
LLYRRRVETDDRLDLCEAHGDPDGRTNQVRCRRGV